MGVSSKKKGNQYRKAIASARASNGGVISDKHHSKICAQFRVGKNREMKNLLSETDFRKWDHDGPYQSYYLRNLESAVTAVLEVLQRCGEDTFDKVIVSVNGDLASPSMWIKVLLKVHELEPSCTLQIAENIGPLIRCMCNDTERLFFRSNRHWKNGIMSFVQLLSDMISGSMIDEINNTDENYKLIADKRVINTLIKHEGLLSSIVQWTFWNDEHRPDIVKVLGADDCEHIVKLGRKTTANIIMDEDNFTEDENGYRIATQDGKKRLRSIGTTPMLNKDYDPPTCNTSFIVGFIRLVKEEGSWQRKPNSSIIEHLIGDADCVDKGVIEEVIDLGTKYASDFECAKIAARLSSFIFCNEMDGNGNSGNKLPCDTRIAFAIRAGLVETCLNFIMRFGWHKSFFRQTDNECLNTSLWCILDFMSEVSLHKKTNKAIRHKKDEIQNQQACLEKIATSNTKVERLFDMVECILDNAGPYCCRCNKSLSRTEVMECNGCHNMTYCSKECQKKDWLNGHSVTCCESYTDASAGQFQGRVLPRTTDVKDEQVLTYDKDGRFQGSTVQPVVPTLVENERAATKLVELEKNITSIQLKLFLDHADYIMSQASSMNIPLWDCVVVFDLRCCPTEVEVIKYTDHYTPKAAKGYRKTRSKENITCIYNSYIFNGTHAAKDDEDKRQYYQVPNLSMQKMFPHEWLLNRK